ncbi:MAG: hemerythrin domain-containing protein [Rubripirellula sp.]
MQSDTKTRGLSINAAFLKDIKDDNHDLKILLDKILPLSQHLQTATNHWPELISLIADLRDQLALHFSLEEAYGYFDDAVGSAPQLSVTAECLRSQHPKLFARIRDLSDTSLEVAADSSEQIDRFLRDFKCFREAFESHEEDELKLILDAMDDDIGVGD